MTQNQLPAPRPQSPAATGPNPPARRPTLGSRPAFWPTAALVGACFLLMFEFLAYQLRTGHDPALGGATASAPPKPPRPVLIRRVVNTRVVEDAGVGTSSAAVSSSGGSSASSTTSAVPAAAPAPAPAPAAPVATSSS
jgi:hypothetical protein